MVYVYVLKVNTLILKLTNVMIIVILLAHNVTMDNAFVLMDNIIIQILKNVIIIVIVHVLYV
jgi:hypothetical protein